MLGKFFKLHNFSGLSILVLILGLLLVSGCGQKPKETGAKAASDTKPVLIRWNLDSGPGNTLSIRAEETKKLVDADPSLKDRVKIELYYSNQLYKPQEAVDALLRGDLELSFVGTWYLEKFAPKISVLEVPFLFKDLQAVCKFFDSPEAEASIYKPLEENGLKFLAGSPVGTYTYLSTKPITKPSDLKGMKIRTVGNGAYPLKECGATPISLSAGDIYIAMQRGTIDGADISPISIADRKLYEVGKYYLDIMVHPISDFCLTNKKWWDGLPEDVKEKLQKYIKQADQKKRQVTLEQQDEVVKKLMPEQNVKVYTPKGEEINQWKSAVQPAMDKVIKEKIKDDQLVKKIQSIQ